MIENFENETYELSDKEKKLLPALVNILQNHVGKNNAIKNYQICEFLNKYNLPVKAQDARVRKMINYIRNNNLVPCLMATSTGYYVTRDPEELESFIRSLNGRIDAIKKVRDSMLEQLNNLKQR
jgi:hypothetical protein